MTYFANLPEEDLKTLKDLSKLEDSDETPLIREDELKAEAIKWVKEYYKEGLEIKEDDWYKFFNLTQEELE